MVVRYCFVPSCENNSSNKPKKLFISVPRQEDLRKQWFEAARSFPVNIPKTKMLYCCEDHFNLEEDAANWMEFKTIGKRLLLKSGAVPHKNILETAEVAVETQLSSSSKKRKKENLDRLQSVKSKRKLNFPENVQPSTSKSLDESPQSDFAVLEDNLISIGVNVKPDTADVSTQANIMKPDTISPTISKESPVTPSTGSTVSSFKPSEHASSSDTPDYVMSENEKEENEQNLKMTMKKIESNSRFYLGLPKSEYFLLDFLSENIKISTRNIMITLKKIRLNDPYLRLGIDFGLSSSMISKIFNKAVPEIANILQEFIHWPDECIIKSNLPLPFIARYKNVQSIIDCLEIEIEQPSNSVHQAQTWSHYKKCNTIKYLISSTPSGLINFISSGYGGRATDKEIVERSGFINILPPDCDVMADRGFKNIENLLIKKKCKLLRPPSVSSTTKMSKEEVLENRRIASLRIHIERVIRRLREFEILAPHACVDVHILPWLDYLILIACGIVNVQGPLIK